MAQERVASGSLCILRRGLVCRRFRFYSNGKVWGEDMILDDPSLIDHTDAVALTYIEVSRHERRASPHRPRTPSRHERLHERLHTARAHRQLSRTA